MKSLILDTLRKLDVDNDKHWTETGTPLLEAVRNIAGDDSLSKQEIAAVAPDFRRDKPELPLIDADPATLMDTPESELTDNERTALNGFCYQSNRRASKPSCCDYGKAQGAGSRFG